MIPKPTLRFTIPGRFDHGADYRRQVQDLSWSALGDQPADQAREWPADSVTLRLTCVNTLKGDRDRTPYQEARLLSNMMKGVIFSTSAILRGLVYKEDDQGTRIEVEVTKVE